MNIEHLRYFIVLARTEHYGQAAEKLCISQPGLSHAITALENELRVSLFQRSGRGIHLDRYGKLLLPEAERIVTMADNCVRNFQMLRQGVGVIRLCTIPLVIIPLVAGLARSFKDQYPQCDFEFSTGMSSTVYQSLKDRQIDIGFCSQVTYDPEMEYVPVQKQHMIVAVPLEHPLAAQDSATLEETLAYSHITYTWTSGLRDTIDRLFAPARDRWHIAYEVEDADFIMELVAQNFGITVMPEVPPVYRPGVKLLRLSAPAWESYFYIVRRKEPYLLSSVATFFDFCVGETRKRLE